MKRHILFAALPIAVFFLDFAHLAASSPQEITIALFRSPKCDTCTSIEPEPLKKLAKKLGIRIQTKTYNVDNDDDYRLLCKTERDLLDYDNEFPTVVVANKILGGNKEIEEGLERTMREAIASGNVALPQILLNAAPSSAQTGSTPISGKPVYAAFFSQGGCASCNRLLASLRYLKSTYSSFDYRTYDTREPESACLFEAICETDNILEADRRKNPAVFVGGKYLLERGVTPTRIERLVSDAIVGGTKKPWEVDETMLAAARQRIVSRFEKLGPWTVLAAGLVDGINPCAFATIVFFITYLTATGRTRREILTVGLVFSIAVFATYFAVGLGALQAIVRLRAYAKISRIIDAGAGAAALLFGIVSVWDYLKARRGKVEEMRLVLPAFLKRKINLNISQQLRLRGILAGAIVAGSLVSLFELACTGQVYLPTIALISGNVVLRVKAFTFLALYNLMFVIPLLLILFMVSFGLSSQRLTSVFRRNIALSKLALAWLFFVIGGIVFLNLWLH